MRIRTGGYITIGMSHSPRDRMENEKNENKDSRRHTIGMFHSPRDRMENEKNENKDRRRHYNRYVPLTQRHNRE
jgi:hypothetical protein